MTRITSGFQAVYGVGIDVVVTVRDRYGAKRTICLPVKGASRPDRYEPPSPDNLLFYCGSADRRITAYPRVEVVEVTSANRTAPGNWSFSRDSRPAREILGGRGG